VIYFDRIKDYLPFARTGSSIFFGFVKENQLFGQALGSTKYAYVCRVICLKPENISYRRSFMRLAPAKFIAVLGQLGFSKLEYIFAVEKVEALTEFEQILDPKAYEQIKAAKLEQPPQNSYKKPL